MTPDNRKAEVRFTVRGMTSSPGATDREVVFTRHLAAPRAAAWRAWTEEERLAGWWGPRKFTNPVCLLDVRPGGGWRIVMRSPEGVEYPLKGTFVEIQAPDRVVLTMDTSEHPASWQEDLDRYRMLKGQHHRPLKLVSTVTFEEDPRGTRIIIVNRFESTDERNAIMQMGMAENWAESLERLETLAGNWAG